MSTVIPFPVHFMPELAARYEQRRSEIARSVDAALVSGRALEIARSAPRSQPRDGRGRFLSKAWLREAESFTARDVAWFRSPIRCTEGK